MTKLCEQYINLIKSNEFYDRDRLREITSNNLDIMTLINLSTYWDELSKQQDEKLNINFYRKYPELTRPDFDDDWAILTNEMKRDNLI